MTREEAKHIVDVAFSIPLAVRKIGEDRTYLEDEVREAKKIAIKALSALDKVIAYCKQSPSAILPEDVLSLIRGEDVEIETDYGYEKFEPCEVAISRQSVLNACEQSINILEAVDRIMDLPSVKPQVSCGDAVSRQAALDAMYELCNTGETLKENPWRDNPHIDAITDAINNLPSVNPLEAVGQDKPKNNVLEQLKNLIDEFNMQDLSYDEMSGFECKVLELLEQNYICDTCKTAGKER